MKTVATIAALVAAVAAGVWLQRAVIGSNSETAMLKDDTAAAKPLYWVAPMDPNYRRDVPGKSPMGMDLVPVYADNTMVEDAVRVSSAIQSSLGVRTEPAQYGPLTQTVRTVGYVSYDEDALRHIHGRVEGWIETLAVRNTGAAVTAGQTLLSLYSPSLVSAQEEYLAARNTGNPMLTRASAERLRAMGMTARQLAELAGSGKASDRVRIVAESDGVVVSLFVREGMYVAPSTHLISIGNLASVWVHAEVLERQASLIVPGAPASIRLDALPGRAWSGVVDFVYPELDPQTRTLKVRLRLDNPDQVLLPNMLADVAIQSPPGTATVHVPRQALIRGGRNSRVALAMGDGLFRVVPVSAGTVAGDRVAILSGINRGDQVVVSGQFLIDSEAAIDAESMRMAPEAPMTPADKVMDHSQHNHGAEGR